MTKTLRQMLEGMDEDFSMEHVLHIQQEGLTGVFAAQNGKMFVSKEETMVFLRERVRAACVEMFNATRVERREYEVGYSDKYRRGWNEAKAEQDFLSAVFFLEPGEVLAVPKHKKL